MTTATLTKQEDVQAVKNAIRDAYKKTIQSMLLAAVVKKNKSLQEQCKKQMDNWETESFKRDFARQTIDSFLSEGLKHGMVGDKKLSEKALMKAQSWAAEFGMLKSTHTACQNIRTFSTYLAEYLQFFCENPVSTQTISGIKDKLEFIRDYNFGFYPEFAAELDLKLSGVKNAVAKYFLHAAEENIHNKWIFGVIGNLEDAKKFGATKEAIAECAKNLAEVLMDKARTEGFKHVLADVRETIQAKLFQFLSDTQKSEIEAKISDLEPIMTEKLLEFTGREINERAINPLLQKNPRTDEDQKTIDLLNDLITGAAKKKQQKILISMTDAIKYGLHYYCGI